MKNLVLKDITVSYDGKSNILENYNLEIKEGELLGLLGPSGSGKSTTLALIAGFINPCKGEVLLGEENIVNKKIEKRDLAIVFQSYALFPHLTIFDNIAFGLKQRKDLNYIKKVNNIIERVGLKGQENKYPKQLSGGQQQRVALARAVVVNPKILLLDEPLSNLDAKLRYEMRDLIREIQQEYKITTLFVTHDQEECFAISDKVAIMNGGEIVQEGKPQSIFTNPINSFVADFIGIENIITDDRGKSVAFRSKDVSVTDDIGDFNDLIITNKIYIAGRFKYTLSSEGIKVVMLSYKDLDVDSKVNVVINKEKIMELKG